MFNQIRLILSVLFVTLSIGSSFAGVDFLDLTLDEAKAKAKSENKLLFIDVYATWCGPCKYLDRKVFPDDELGEYMNANFINLHLDGEEGDGLFLMNEYSLNSYPTMLFIDSDGVLKKKIVGAEDAESIQKTAVGLLDPSSSPLFVAKTKYDKGDRSREVVKTYAVELISAGDNANGEEVANVFVELFPDIENYDAEEFGIFYMSNDNLSLPVVKLFLEDIETYKKEYEQYTFEKLKNVIGTLILEAYQTKNPELIKNQVDYLYPVAQKVYEDDFTRDEFEKILLETYQSYLEEE